MPAAVANHIRKEIIERRKNGETYQAISEAVGVGYHTVRGVWRYYQKSGTIKPNYEACRQTGVRKPPDVYEAAVALKQAHPTWGAQLIRLELAAAGFAASELPSVRTLQSWFRRVGLSRPPRARHTTTTIKRGQAVHEVWAIDAKEKMTLGDDSGASWLTITDEASGAILYTAAFPPQALESS